MRMDGSTIASLRNQVTGVITMLGDDTIPTTTVTGFPTCGGTLLIEPNVSNGAILRLVNPTENFGSITLSSSGVNAPAVIEAVDASHQLTNSNLGVITINQGAGGSRLINMQLINRAQVFINADTTIGASTGRVWNDAAGLMDIAPQAAVTLVGSGSTPHENKGQVIVRGSMNAQLSATNALRNIGVIEMRQDSMVTATGGRLVNSAGEFMPISGKILGTGIINAASGFDNGGVLYPTWTSGATTAVLSINGPLTQLPNQGIMSLSSEIRIDQRNGGSGPEFSALSVTGLVSLRGKLFVRPNTEVQHTTGSTFDILTAPLISGTFSVAQLPGLPGGQFMTVSYTSTAAPVTTVRLSVQSLQNLVGLGQPQSQALPGPPTAGVLGDFDADGDQDMAICITAALPGNPGSVLVLFNAGTVGGVWQGFSSSTQITVGVDPVSIATGLIDANASLDLAVVNQGSDSVWILRNNGNSTFSVLGSPIPTNVHPTSIAIADLDSLPLAFGAGGTVDIVVSAFGPEDANGTVEVLGNDGTGAYVPIVETPVGIQPVRVTVGDVDGDRNIDVVSADQGSGSVTVLDNPGDGKVGRGVEYITGDNPADVQCVSLDGDGLVDVVVVNESTADPAGSVSILLNDSSRPGTLLAASNLEVGDDPHSVAVGDFDVDGDMDLAVLQVVDGDSVVQVLRNDTSTDPDAVLIMATAESATVGEGSVFVLAGDLDDAAGDDLLAVNEGADPLSGAHGRNAIGPQPDVSIILNDGGAACIGDVAPSGGNDVVDIDDLVLVITHWNAQGPDPADITHNGVVDIDDLVQVITHWGACP